MALDDFGDNVRPFRRPDEEPPVDFDYLASLGAPAQAPQPRKLEIVSAASLAGRSVEPRPWLVPDLLPDRQVAILSGDGGVGKSLLALQLAVAVASGTDWIGTLPITGPALYVGAEDELDEMHRRLNEIAASRSLDLAALGDLHILSLAGESAVLAAGEGREGLVAMSPLWAALEERVAALRPRLLILDNAADVFAGNEISRSQVRQFVSALRGAAIRYDMAVLLLAHPSVAGMNSGTGTSGSTAWSNSVRARLYLDRPKNEDGGQPDPNARVLRVMKSNYAATGAETRLRWGAGVLRLDGAGLSGLDRAAADARAEHVFLDLLNRLTSQGRHVSHQRCNSFAPKTFANEPDNGGLSKAAFESAMARLFAAGRIRVATHGPPSKQRSHLVETLVG